MSRRSLHEHWIEDALARRCAELGHLCLKFISPGFPGVPDRIVLTAAGQVVFVEVKAPGQKPARTQPQVLELLRQMGHRAEVIDTHAQIDSLLRSLA